MEELIYIKIFFYPGLANSIMLFTDALDPKKFVYRLFSFLAFIFLMLLFRKILYGRYLLWLMFSFTANGKFSQRHDSVYNHCQATRRLSIPPKFFAQDI